jgi:tRNA nucleotidyltransferase/poly(A) polymerase
VLTPLSDSQFFGSPGQQVQQIVDFVRRRSSEAWLVGGFVRDRLLQRETNDLDVIVPTGAIALARAVADAFAGQFFVLDEGRDVARTVLQGPRGRSLNVDVARLRASELARDLGLRDFTVNAMAVSIRSGTVAEVIDPFGGRIDLRHGVIRVVAEGAFLDDPLRLLRAIRQAAELGFRVDDATYGLIHRDAALLTTVSAERVRDELARILSLPGSWESLQVLQDTGLLVRVLPEAAALVGVTQSAPHYQDVFVHTRSVLAHLEGLYGLIWPAKATRILERSQKDGPPLLDAVAWTELATVIEPYSQELGEYIGAAVSGARSRRDCLVWAALAHDWGKPVTRSVDENGKVRFLEHDRWGAVMTQARLRALRMSSDEVDYISRLVGFHMRPGYLTHDYPPSRRAVYRFFRDSAGSGPDCVLLSLADYAAIRAGNPYLEAWGRRLNTAGLLLGAYFLERPQRVDPVPLLDGRQLMAAFGLPQGPRVGMLLEGLREAQAAGEITRYEEALTWLAQQLTKGDE